MIYLNLLYRAFSIEDKDKSFVKSCLNLLLKNNHISDLDIYNSIKINLYNNNNINEFIRKNSNLTLDKLLLFCNPTLITHVVNPNNNNIHKNGVMYVHKVDNDSYQHNNNNLNGFEIYYIKTNEK